MLALNWLLIYAVNRPQFCPKSSDITISTYMHVYNFVHNYVNEETECISV